MMESFAELRTDFQSVNGECVGTTDDVDLLPTGADLGNKVSFLRDPVIKSRELFISDATDTYPVSLLR